MGPGASRKPRAGHKVGLQRGTMPIARREAFRVPDPPIQAQGLRDPGQAGAHASSLNYDVGSDPLIPQMRRELVRLHAYALWQSQHMRRIAARTLDPSKTLDEQALEAALAARWRLITKPTLEVRRRRQPPRWIAIGFCLDPASERTLIQQSQRRISDIEHQMGQGAESS